jgi:phosphoserine phosphatase
MKTEKRGKVRKEVNEVKESERNIAAFFDLDGTLTPLPSLERRFFRILRYRGEIPARNYFLWLTEALRLLPRGISALWHANKMYVRGVHILDECGQRDRHVSSWHKGGHQVEGQASAPPRCDPRLPVLGFLAQGVERVAWHAKQGHKIVLVSGTLEPLAWEAARAIEGELAARGIATEIRVCATRLEEKNGKWTGRILGEAMFGKVKACVAKRLAEELQLDLKQCYAYGDSLYDRWLMDAVGKPAAVNPPMDLLSLARKRAWTVLHWDEKENQSPWDRGLKVQRDCRMELPRSENAQ